MVKKILFLITLTALVVSCDRKQAERQNPTGSTDTVSTIPNSPSLQDNSVDGMRINQGVVSADGVYSGVIPCADCEGIETEVFLNKDGTYVLKTKYLGKGNGEVYESTGRYNWRKEEANRVILDNDKMEYTLQEGRLLIQLDQDGNNVTGDMADKYILTKH